MNKFCEVYELHKTLNPKLWVNDKLIDEVVDALKETVQEFLKYIEIPLNIVDVDIVGSNASYNYNDKSDIDLHIIVNNELSYMDDTILQQLYDAKKTSFNRNYDISIHGIPVELYIESVNSSNATNGRYSILKNKWIQFPKPIKYTLPDISSELKDMLDKCNNMLNSNDLIEVQDFINQIYMSRKLGLAEEGELSTGNLIFKELRNRNLLQALKDHYFELKNEELSI